MTAFLDQYPLPQWLQGTPPHVWWGAAAALILVIVVVAGLIIAGRLLFIRRLRAALENPGLAGALIRDRYTPSALLRRSRLIERLADKAGASVIEVTGIGQLWIDRLGEGRSLGRGRRKDMLRVLRFVPEQGLFVAFQAGLEVPALAAELIRWLEGAGELLQLRRVAQAGAGQTFDGLKAQALFKDKLDQVRELAGDPEWGPRFFAIQILLHEDEPRARQALWDAFSDPHPLVRKTLLRDLKSDERDRLYAQLHAMYLRDPAFEVRQAAWTRIHAEFSDLYTLATEGLGEEETLHVLEQLREGIKDDENFAMGFLQSDNLEFRLMAAEFLQRSGGLMRLCLAVDLGDREGLERHYTLLSKAAEVNIYTFVGGCIKETGNPATLFLCARLLREFSQLEEAVTALAEKVFRLFDGGAALHELYRTTLACIAERGGTNAYRLVGEQLNRWRLDEPVMTMLLEALPPKASEIFLPHLMGFFQDPAYPYRTPVRDALKRMPVPVVLPPVLALIKTPRETVPVPVRVDSVKLLGEMGLSYCLQTVLESLWVLPPEDSNAFMDALKTYPRDLLSSKVKQMLGTTDSRIRASIIASLPATEDPQFIAHIRGILSDVDPDVRVAGIWALSEFKEVEWSDEDIAVLRDPVESVRAEAARALGAAGTEAVIKVLAARLDDPEESESVKFAALDGLGHVRLPPAIDVLIAHLDGGEEFRERIITNLARKINPAELSRLFEFFKDASPPGREHLTRVFQLMGATGGRAMAGLLREDIASLKPFILDVLESTGHIEFQIRRLSHKEAAVRRVAADFLTTISTLPALRGLVLAAKDPDEEVRVSVVKALEALSTDQSSDILQSLRNDPARKVRRYTLWALERVKAKSL